MEEISSKFHNFSGLLESKKFFIFSNESPVQVDIKTLNLNNSLPFQLGPDFVFSEGESGMDGWLSSLFPALPFPQLTSYGV